MGGSRRSLRNLGLCFLAPVPLAAIFWIISPQTFFFVFLKTRSPLTHLIVVGGLVGLVLLAVAFAMPEGQQLQPGIPAKASAGHEPPSTSSGRSGCLIFIGLALMAPLVLLLFTTMGRHDSMMREAFVWPVLFAMVAFVGFLLCLVGVVTAIVSRKSSL